jgi:hypothetical protein
VLAGWAGAGPSWANGQDTRVKKKMGRPVGPVRGGVGFWPKIGKRIGKLSIFKYLYKMQINLNSNKFNLRKTSSHKIKHESTSSH